MPDEKALSDEVPAWERERNEQGAKVEWRFTAEDAHAKLARLYLAQS